MHLVPKRLLLVGAAPFALAAVYGVSLAFAQDGEEPTPSPTEDTAPASPTPDSTAPESPDREGCPEKDGSGGESDGTESSTQIRTRANRAQSRPF